MERCNYTEVFTDNDDIHKSDEHDCVTWKQLFRQLIVCSGVWGCYFVLGMSMGAITVFVPQLRREANSTDVISFETVSWLASSFGYAAIPWLFILPALSNRFGRRLPFRLVSIMAIVSSIVFYCSTNIVHILISEILISAAAAAHIPVLIVIIAEFSSPKYRGFFLTMKSASFNWGIWAANAIGTYFHWKNIGIVQITCSLYIFISAIFWPESPFWLASNGKFEECRNAYYLLRGSGQRAKIELKHILNSGKRPVDTNNSITFKLKTATFFRKITSKKIYKPVLLTMILNTFLYCTGKAICTMYAIDIIKDISGSESVAYTVMLVLDGITVFSMYVGCVVSTFVSRRMMLFCTSFVGVSSLIIISLYLYLSSICVIAENKYITTFLLIVYSLGISAGPLILCTSICSELLPLECRNFVSFGAGLYDRIVLGTSMKIFPYIFTSFGIHRAFLFFALSCICLLLLLYKYLPETKDKTLHEIERLVEGIKMSDLIENEDSLNMQSK